MKEDPELQMNDGSPDNRTYPSKRRRIGSDGDRTAPGHDNIFPRSYFWREASFISLANSLRKVTHLCTRRSASLEEKIAGPRKTDRRPGREIGGRSPDPSLLNRVDVSVPEGGGT